MVLTVAIGIASLAKRKTWLVGVVALAAVVALGLLRPGKISVDPDKAIRVSVVQDEEVGLRELIELTRGAATNQPQLVIWPEYALGYDVRLHPASIKLLTNLCTELDIMLLLGTKTEPPARRSQWHNTALLMDGGGVLGEYYKARPIHFFDDGEPGKSFHSHATALGRMATPICFDGDYTAVMRQMAVQGCEFYAMPVMDAKRWTARQHLQHAALLHCRAAETGRWIASAASSGVSQFIDPHGQVHASLPPMVAGTLTHEIEARAGKTFFVKAGWLFPWMVLLAFGGLLGFAARCLRAEKRRASARHPSSD